MSSPKSAARPLGPLIKNLLMFIVAAAVAAVVVHLVKTQLFPRLPSPIAELVGARQ
ncbi:MAG: hypothetical protein Q8K11_10160 [Phenylobacterium sp.]|uniref:Uncharacterized protein n=1 Tax=Phenylobacterium ferrooxidans TaxID=2982689 RepID=A0ABW6CKH8_9CAUL|nr:hypothetical protein [Phenylobacterium sp.]MDP2010529.1 hypothetical protein [Phenylobacterium sp.]MDP3633952.1 hypothetical protein [Phenylobacterium sp.]HQT52780.1 hypothetical protein [Phenylobacterium sp.]